MTTSHCLSGSRGYRDHSNRVLFFSDVLGWDTDIMLFDCSWYTNQIATLHLPNDCTRANNNIRMKTRVTQLYSIVLAAAELLDRSPIDAHHQTSRYGGGVASAKQRDIFNSAILSVQERHNCSSLCEFQRRHRLLHRYNLALILAKPP